jgi:putative FmdB family regulatory protein
MPIYEYRCGSCGHLLDALQKLSDPPLEDCPECSEPKLKRLMSAPRFRLKGGGWYETDFKSDKEKRRNLADGAEAKAADKPSGDDKKTSSEPGKDKPGKDKSDKKEKSATTASKASGSEAA